MAAHREFSTILRAQAVTLKHVGWSNKSIAAYTGVSERRVRQLYVQAIQRGWNPAQSIVLKDEHLADKPRCGRPKKTKTQDSQPSASNVGEDAILHTLSDHGSDSAPTSSTRVASTLSGSINHKETPILEEHHNAS